MSASECPEWVIHARRFIGADDKESLDKAKNACTDPAIREFLSRPDLGMLPPDKFRPLLDQLTSEGRATEAAAVQILALLRVASAADSPERLDDKGREFTTSVCTHCASLSREYGFPECEALFARTLGTGRAEMHEWRESEALLAHAVALYRGLAASDPDVYGKHVAWTLSNLGNVLEKIPHCGDEAVMVSPEAVNAAEDDAIPAGHRWLAKGQASAAYRRALAHFAGSDKKDAAFRYLAAMREGPVRALTTPL